MALALIVICLAGLILGIALNVTGGKRWSS